jgi:hypothetical protein
MCTVTYLPYQQGFILTHNRDEAPTRSPHAITAAESGSDQLIFPKDTKAGGTWIATSRQGKTACLLNGAFVKHHHAPPYRRSRGLMLLDFFTWKSPADFFENYDLEGIEPFTLLFFHTSHLIEFRWDGQQRFVRALDPAAAHFWCSSTLYPPAIQIQREEIFRTWLQTHPSALQNPASILQLHHEGSVGDPENDYIMNRSERVRTVSITQITQQNLVTSMYYEDLLEGVTDTKALFEN